jgi:hypothetical protein
MLLFLIYLIQCDDYMQKKQSLKLLFFSLGNQTPHISSVLLSRVFIDEKLKLFDYSDEQLVDQVN